MKKVLYATTALVATAGFATAQVADDMGVVDPMAAPAPVAVAPVAEAPAIDSVGVAITGFAELGVFDPGGDDGQIQFHTDIDATFTMVGETDGGLSFGADIDIDETDSDQTISGTPVNRTGGDTPELQEADLDVDGDGTITSGELNNFLDQQNQQLGDIEIGGSPAFDNSKQGGESIFISGTFGTLTMGDTDGALDWALQEAIIGAALNDDNEHDGYNGNPGFDGAYDGQIARYEYAFGDFAVAVSAEIDDTGDNDPVLGIGARYATSIALAGRDLGLGFGLGYQRIDSFQDIGDEIGDQINDRDDDTESADIVGISADIDFGGGFSGIINYSDSDTALDRPAQEHVGIALGYTIDALTVAANYGKFSRDDVDVTDDDGVVTGTRSNDLDGYSVIVNYDLGSGAEAQFGYGHSSFTDDDGDQDRDQFSLGIAMAF